MRYNWQVLLAWGSLVVFLASLFVVVWFYVIPSSDFPGGLTALMFMLLLVLSSLFVFVASLLSTPWGQYVSSGEAYEDAEAYYSNDVLSGRAFRRKGRLTAEERATDERIAGYNRNKLTLDELGFPSLSAALGRAGELKSPYAPGRDYPYGLSEYYETREM
jgi:hypothetical protein